MTTSVTTVILEARINKDIVRIGSCRDPLFTEDDRILIPKAIITPDFGFRLKEVDLAEWLRKQMLILTRVINTEGYHGTTSWVCNFVSLNDFSKVNDEIYAVTDLVLEHRRTHEQ